jgi:hypothetical protein
LRLAGALVLSVFLAACQAAVPRATATPSADGRALAIVAYDRQPLTQALLLAQDGRIFEGTIEVAPRAAERPSFGVGASGGSSSGIGTGFGVSIPIGGGGLVESHALILLPADARPAAGLVRLRFGATRTLEFGVPAR